MNNPNYQTTNRSNRNININFDQRQFNKMFEENDEKREKEIIQENSIDMIKQDEIIEDKMPHQKSIEDIIVNIRELFYKIIEFINEGKNPIPYILQTPERLFSLSILIIFLGTLILLLSNIMK